MKAVMGTRRSTSALTGAAVVLLLLAASMGCSMMEQKATLGISSSPTPTPYKSQEAITASHESTSSRVPTEEPAPSVDPWWTTPPPAVITCSIQTLAATPVDYPLDPVRLGHTDRERVRELFGSPDEVYGEEKRYWYYAYPLNTSFYFQDDILAGWREDRTLEEILMWHGMPAQVIWSLPKFDSGEAVESTYLLFPERERFCEIDGWIYELRSDQLLRCFWFTPDTFDTLAFPYPVGETEGYWIVSMDWPCPDY